MKILLIEDDLDDIEFLQEAFKNQGVEVDMDIANDGSAAVNHIRTARQYPDIIILDLNLPKIHGREVILEIKSSPAFQLVPLLILTTSSAREDMEYAYRHGADKYVIKPTTLEQIRQTVNTILSLLQK
ncbi:MAG TPA: response regulator [Chitinophagaceae bacterium]|jgi:DNA-binding response OmpR family regulator